MKQPEDPLAWWERSGTRRAVAISFSVGLLAAVLTIFPDVSQFYDKHSTLRNLLGAVTAGLGLALVFFELRHSGEANEHRAEHNRLTKQANKSREEALKLQVQVYQLQESIEKKVTKVRLYPRAHKAIANILHKPHNVPCRSFPHDRASVSCPRDRAHAISNLKFGNFR
jgi:hypothetical protein